VNYECNFRFSVSAHDLHAVFHMF